MRTICISFQPYFHLLFSICYLFWFLISSVLNCVSNLFLSTSLDVSIIFGSLFSVLCQLSWNRNITIIRITVFVVFVLFFMLFLFLYPQKQIIWHFPPTLLLALNCLPSNIYMYYRDNCHLDACYLPRGI